MLVDEIKKLILHAGNGGNGKMSFFPGFKSGPDGGNGGKGGDVVVKAINDIFALTKYISQNEFRAQAGQAGGSNRRTGHSGDNLELTVPIGTVLINNQDPNDLYEFNQEGQMHIVCKGGKGGKGNHDLKSSLLTTPKHAQPGHPGETKKFTAILKLIADIGLIGLPNAGKSSLLAHITAAKPKIGAYPFTTLEPNLGAINNLIIADIPGLIEGAASGKGLGHKFLQHIEKIPVLLHCISCETQDALANYKTINSELKAYNPQLLEKPQTILLTKTDLVDEKRLKELRQQLQSLNIPIYAVSIHDLDSLEALDEILK